MDQETDWTLQRAKIITTDELKMILSRAKDVSDTLHLIIALAYNGAMRITEVLHLKGEDFRFNYSIVRVRPLKKKTGGVPRPVEVDIPKNVMDAAEAYIKKHKIHSDGYLFPCPGSKCRTTWCPGGHMYRQRIQEGFHQVLLDLGIYEKGRGIHVMKHLKLTNTALETKDPYYVRMIGRHSGIGMSLKYVDYTKSKDRFKASEGIV